jgi:iron(III) transport system substrate-binding protein
MNLHRYALSTTAVLVGMSAIGLGVTQFATAAAHRQPHKQSAGLTDLIRAAKKEGTVVVWDSSGHIRQIGAAFQKLYGIKVTAVKMSPTQQVEKITAEFRANHVTADVMDIGDAAALKLDLMPRHIVRSYVPAWKRADIPPADRDPLAYIWNSYALYYNRAAYGPHSPLKNIWQLTQPAWRHRLVMKSPMSDATMLELLTYASIHDNRQLATAYTRLFHHPVPGGVGAAGMLFIKDLAKNDPVNVTGEGTIISDIADSTRKTPVVGFLTDAQYPHALKEGVHLGISLGTDPWFGFAYPKFSVIPTKAPDPAAAELFVNFLLSARGLHFEDHGGGFSSDKKVARGTGAAPGLVDSPRQLLFFNPAQVASVEQSEVHVLNVYEENLGNQ